MSGLIISVVAGGLITSLRMYFGLGRANRHLLFMVPPGLIPIYWIYKSEKLQEVIVDLPQIEKIQNNFLEEFNVLAF